MVEQIDYRKEGGAFGVVLRGIGRMVKKGGAKTVAGIRTSYVAVGEAINEAFVTHDPPEESGPTAGEASSEDQEHVSPDDREVEPQTPRGPRKIWQGSKTYDYLRGIAP